MPATFESFGVKFLYPENWTLLERDQGEGETGMTLELPSGGFFSIERVDPSSDPESLIDSVADALRAEYDEIERESIELAGGGDHTAADIRFYYLDLVVVSRVIVLNSESGPLLVQFQAEIRDFEQNEKVVEAILLQVKGER